MVPVAHVLGGYDLYFNFCRFRALACTASDSLRAVFFLYNINMCIIHGYLSKISYVYLLVISSGGVAYTLFDHWRATFCVITVARDRDSDSERLLYFGGVIFYYSRKRSR